MAKISCPNCADRVVIDPSYLVYLKDTLATTTAELVAFCQKKKLDHTKLPVLEELGQAMRILRDIE